MVTRAHVTSMLATVPPASSGLDRRMERASSFVKGTSLAQSFNTLTDGLRSFASEALPLAGEHAPTRCAVLVSTLMPCLAPKPASNLSLTSAEQDFVLLLGSAFATSKFVRRIVRCWRAGGKPSEISRLVYFTLIFPVPIGVTAAHRLLHVVRRSWRPT